MKREALSESSEKNGSLVRRSIKLIDLARKTFALGEEGDSSLAMMPHEITLENFPALLDVCPIVKKVYVFRVKLYALEKCGKGHLTEGQKMSLLIDSAIGLSQLAKILSYNKELLDKIRADHGALTKEEENVLDDLTIALSKILLSQSITIKKRRTSTKKKPAQ